MRAIHLQNNGYLVANNNEVYNFGTGNLSMKAWVYSSTGGPVISRKSTAGGVGEWRIRMDEHYRRWYWIRLSNQQSHQRARWHLASRCGSMRTDLCSNLSRWRAGCKWPQIRRQATIPGCKQQYAIVHWQYWSGAATPSVLCWLDDWDPNMERGQGRENNQGMRAGSERKRAGRLLAIWFWSSSRLFSNS